MIIKCEKLIYLKQSLCQNGITVKYLLPGEEANYVKQAKHIIKAEDVLKKDDSRIDVKCPIFYECGGCDFLHVSYQKELKLKKEYVKSVYQEIGLSLLVRDVIYNPTEHHYRHKVVASATTYKNKLRLGLYREGTKEVIPFLTCLIQDRKANHLLQTVESVLNKYKIKAYDMDKNSGIIKHIMIRKSFFDQSILLTIVTHQTLLPNAKSIAKDIIEAHPNVKGVMQNIHRRNTSMVLLDEEKLIFGQSKIEDRIDDLRFKISSRSFYQINPSQMMVLYKKALELAQIEKHHLVIDTYSGIGTISLLASRLAKKVVAIESNRFAHLDAVENKKNNHIENVEFILSDVESFLVDFKDKVDCLIMDPTRDGSSESFLNAVKKLKPQKIVYISCNVETQVRDIKILTDLYDVKDVLPLDMFSRTSHVETISLLSLN
jgi:23S rRNA (uracil1939-C5)-methyltransferase